MNSGIFISVICPVYNEGDYITGCLESVLKQDYPHHLTEIFFVDGMSTDQTREIVTEYSKKYSFLRMLDNCQRTVPHAMNIGIRHSVGEYIIRLDAHSQYPPVYFSQLIDYAKKLNSDNVGGVCNTSVKNKNQKSLAITEVLSSRLGVGNSIFRTGAKNITEVDTVVFGCFKRDVFDRFGLYDERLVRNQDIELNKRIKRGGGKLYLVPEIQCTYFARETFGGLVKNNFQNGLWNILTVFYTKTLGSLSLRHFIPLFFLVSLILPPLLAIGYFPLILIGIVTSLLYIIMMLSSSFYLSRKKNVNMIYLFVSFFLMHFSYGSGSLIAILKLPFLKK